MIASILHGCLAALWTGQLLLQPTGAPTPPADPCRMRESQAWVKVVLTLDTVGVDQPRLTNTTTVDLPASWPQAAKLRGGSASSAYQAALSCLIPDQAWVERRGPPAVHFSDALLTVTDTVVLDLTDWDSFHVNVGPWWLEQDGHHRIELQLQSTPATSTASWEVTLRGKGIRILERHLTPTDDAKPGEISWRLTKVPSGKGEDRPMPIVAVEPRLLARLALASNTDSGMRQLIWTGAALAASGLFILILVLTRPSLRADPGDGDPVRSYVRGLMWFAIAVTLGYWWLLFYDRLPGALLLYVLAVGGWLAGRLLEPRARSMPVRATWTLAIVGSLILVFPGLVGLTPDLTPGAVPDTPAEVTTGWLPALWLLVPLLIMTFLCIGGTASAVGLLLRGGDRRRLRVANRAVVLGAALLAIATVAQWAWSTYDLWLRNHLYDELSRRSAQATRQVIQQAAFYADGLSFHFISLLWYVGVAALVCLLQARSRLGDGVVFADPRPIELSLTAALFAAATTGNYGWFLGIYLPVAFLLAYAGLRHLVIRVPPEPEKLHALPVDDQAGQQLLLDAAERLELLRGRVDRVETSFLNGELSESEHRDQRAALDATIATLARGPISDSLLGDAGQPTEPRSLRARIRTRLRRPARPATDEQTSSLVIRLPERMEPGDVALLLGPTRNWWSNGVAAAKIGVLIGALPAIYLLYYRFAQVQEPFGPLSWWFAGIALPLDVLHEVAFWIGGSFALGALWAYLPGRRGLVKGLSLAVVYLAADGVDRLLSWRLGQEVQHGVLLRFSLFAVVLSLVGAEMDRRTLAGRSRQWNEFVGFYRLGSMGRAGNLAVYTVGALAAAFGLWQQLKGVQEQHASEETVKALADLVRQATDKQGK